jgi:hypothetical protein
MLLNRPYLNLTRLNPENDEYWQLTVSFILDERRRFADITDEGVREGTRNIVLTYFQENDPAQPDSINSVTTIQRIIKREEGENQVYVYFRQVFAPITIYDNDKDKSTEVTAEPFLIGGGEGSTGSYHP